MNMKTIALAMLVVLPACVPPVSPPDPRLVNGLVVPIPDSDSDVMADWAYLQNLFANKTHRVPYYYKETSVPIMMGNRIVSHANVNTPYAAPETRYFAKNGKAWFLLEDEKRVVTGEWRLVKNGGYIMICAAPGYIPQEVDRSFFEKNCASSGEYVEHMTHFRAGDPLELQKQK